MVDKTRYDREFLTDELKVDGSEHGVDSFHSKETSTLSKYLDRFRNSEPLSRDLRNIDKSDFWWLDRPVKETSISPNDSSTPKSKKITACSENGSCQLLSHNLLARFDEEHSKDLQRRADELLSKIDTNSTGNSAEPIVSTDGLGSIQSDDSFTHLKSDKQPQQRQPQKQPSGFGSTAKPLNKEDDILYQWRLRRRLEKARENNQFTHEPKKQTHQFQSELAKSWTDGHAKIPPVQNDFEKPKPTRICPPDEVLSSLQQRLTDRLTESNPVYKKSSEIQTDASTSWDLSDPSEKRKTVTFHETSVQTSLDLNHPPSGREITDAATDFLVDKAIDVYKKDVGVQMCNKKNTENSSNYKHLSDQGVMCTLFTPETLTHDKCAPAKLLSDQSPSTNVIQENETVVGENQSVGSVDYATSSVEPVKSFSRARLLAKSQKSEQIASVVSQPATVAAPIDNAIQQTVQHNLFDSISDNDLTFQQSESEKIERESSQTPDIKDLFVFEELSDEDLEDGILRSLCHRRQHFLDQYTKICEMLTNFNS